MNDSIAKLIIENCHNDFSFEQFSLEICSAEHKIQFLPTSQSWDRGRDGRSAGPSRGSHRNLLCSTLNREIDGKVEADLLRITATSSPDHLIYCSSQYLSEEKADQLTKSIKRHAPSGGSTVYGSLQLAKLATKFPQVFEKHFHAEIESIRETLRSDVSSNDEQKRSLRLALLTAGQSEGATLREDVLKRVVMERLSKDAPHSATEVAQEFSTDFGLPRRIEAATIDRVARELVQEGLTQWSRGGWQLTDAGEQIISTYPPEAADAILTGRAVIRNGIDTLIGKKLSDDQHMRIWSTLLDFLSSLFYKNGLDVIRTLEGILHEEQEEIDTASLQEMLRDGARRVASASSSFPDDQDLIQTAILDLLTEREPPLIG